MADDLGRWAAERAPALLARAEAEAVALLRDALVSAALPRPRSARAPEPAPPRAEQPGDVLWVYCVTRAGMATAPEGAGVAGGRVELVAAGELAALVGRVPLAEFGEEPLRRNLNDLPWLEQVARAHEDVLERTLPVATIAPLRLCTIYDDADRVRGMLERGRARFLEALDALEGHQEWGVKVLLDPARLAEAARRDVPDADTEAARLGAQGEGAGYLLQRRLERKVAEAADALSAAIAHQVHARVQDWAVDAVTRPPQNRDLSGHEGDMALNAAYLVEADRVDGLRELVAELQAQHGPVGATIELTGPWPPYNFVPGGAEALA